MSVLAVLMLVSVSGADPALDADPRAGRALAEQSCAECHAVGRGGASPRKDAPPFREVMRRARPEEVRDALADGFFVAHPEMPKFALKEAEVDDLVAYLETLRR